MEVGESSDNKRKRSGSDSDSSDVDEGEFELYTKYYTIKRDKSQVPINYTETDEVSAVDIPRRKRKYLNKDDFVPTKRGKFYFLTDKMTKPKRPKASSTSINPNRKHKINYVKIGPAGNLCLAQRAQTSVDVNIVDNNFNIETFKKVDLSFHVVDEIALEGLDGITLEAFWKRLLCVFPNVISKSIATLIWKMICKNKRISFSILEEPRDELISFDRNKFVDESGSIIDPFLEYKDIYPFVIVNSAGVRGSCATFETRKEFNNLRKFSLDKAWKQFDQKLVMVADQELRNKALMSEETDPNIELMDLEYCLLERIGRSRRQGELTSGETSLSFLLTNMANLHHRKKNLQSYGLMVNQTLHVRSLTKQQLISGGLLQLTRFYKKRKTRRIVIMEQLGKILRDRPNFQMELTEFRKLFGGSMFVRKLIKSADFRRFFRIYTVTYRRLHPNATRSEYMTKSQSCERMIRVLRMTNPLSNIAAILMGDKEKKQDVGERENLGRKVLNMDLLHDIYSYIQSMGTEGVTLHEILEYSSMDFYVLRLAVKKLLLRNVICSHKVDLGRQQSLKFCAISNNCEIANERSYELSNKTKDNLQHLLGYQSQIETVKYENDTNSPSITKPLSIDLVSEPFVCTNFLTETVDSISEESTIQNIILKGRDRLLLLQSNLFDSYLSEWDDQIMSPVNDFKDLALFQNGFGRIIYQFLCEIKPFDTIEADNKIIFDAESLSKHTKVDVKINTIILNICNFNFAYASVASKDFYSSIYLFQSMFDENHTPGKTVAQLDSNMYAKIEKVDVKPDMQVEIVGSVQIESLMGAKPILLEHFGDQDDLETLIYTSTPSMKTPTEHFDGSHLDYTRRYLKRANSILQYVNDERIVKGLQQVVHHVKSTEKLEGYDKTVCKKSIRSIVAKLIEDGYIKAIQYAIRGKNTVRSQTFLCNLNVSVHDAVITTSMDEMKMKFFTGMGNTLKKNVVKVKPPESPFSDQDVRASINELKQLTCRNTGIIYGIDKTRSKTYGYYPKFGRMRVLHEFLFYLTRCTIKEQPLDKAQTFDWFTRNKMKATKEEIDVMPPIYCDEEISWKMFVNPLPNHPWPKGWLIACDIILRMPLSIFVKLYQIWYDMPELQDYLNDPIKRHYLIKHLPADIRNVLLYRKKYFYGFYESFTWLCYIGLAQIGARNFKDKDQVFLFVNTKCCLYDTTTSQGGYNKIEDKKYKRIKSDLTTLKDVEEYWTEMMRICTNTQLGKRKMLDGQTVTIEEPQTKPAMLLAVKPKKFQQAEIDDNGIVPGDRLGAAGTDSSLTMFVKRNWVWRTQQNRKMPTIKMENPLPSTGEQNESITPPKPLKKSNKLTVQTKKKRKKTRRVIKSAYRAKVREYHDETDKKIMAKNQHIRVDWDEHEDQILRFSRVAYAFLCPHYNKQYIPYNIMRDLMHRLYPKSRNKTSKAIQRRIYLLLMSDEVLKIMEGNVDNLLNSPVIVQYFAQVRNRFGTSQKVPDQKLFICYIYLVSYLLRHKKEIELLLLGYVATMDFFSPPYITLFENVLENSGVDKIDIYTSPKSAQDVCKETIKSIIHCSLACQQHNVGWAYQLFHIYGKLPDDLIRQCVVELRKRQLLVFHRGVADRNVTETWHSPLKFSQSYNSMRASTHSVKNYQESYSKLTAILKTRSGNGDLLAFNELATFHTELTYTFDIPEMGLILNPEMHDHSDVIDELARRFHCYLTKLAERRTNKADAVQPMKTIDLQRVKNEVMQLIFRVPYLFEGNLEMYFKRMSDSSDDLEVRNFIWLMTDDLKRFACKEKSAFVDAIREEGDVEKLMRNMSRIVFFIQYIGQGNSEKDCDQIERKFNQWECEELGRNTTKDDEDTRARYRRRTGMEDCIKQAENGVFPTLDEIKVGMMENDNGTERAIPHITDLITLLNEGRFPEFDTDRADIEKMKQHFIMQYPKLQQFTVGNLHELRTTPQICKLTNRQKLIDIKNNVRRSTIIDEPNSIEKMMKEHPIMEILLAFIKDKKELGATSEELKALFTDTKLLLETIQYLCNNSVILRTGVTGFLYVHNEYQRDWLTETFSFTESEKRIFSEQTKPLLKKIKSLIDARIKETGPLKVQLKPWTTLDGFLIESVFNDWLCLVLSKCLNYPNMMFSHLCEQFPYVKPVDLFYLLEVLENLGCVQLFSYVREEIDLFSSKKSVPEEKATYLHDFDEIFIKVTNVSGLSFGAFLCCDCYIDI